ncbi:MULTISPECIES: LacI family DNA-binding transcriptional regulator [Kitasatospora]|uniref:Putative LacI family transcriptional regulator n=1 Tax=Kitasatospora setae (strain ATCC 33774 / DSM 43861 / JCM 3304 / KCC A-0304 / NBRC 14216 / KM-6054) TaxID=452652 RepID=E4NJJ5_KITSK|nr:MULTISPECIES: LacI family DNA-binding transcriptional regulator [Kitasatospora]BAJ33143.1 putative LacI family transcriptional regulator [Kitasatospora setae KM-6054]
MDETGERRPPTMADVAQVAGVSHQTVSRVLSDHPNVREATRERVLRAIAELGYRPNSAARTLVTRRSRTLGVVAANTTLFGPASILAGLERAARREDYLVASVGLEELTEHALASALERLGSWGVDGAVVMTPHRHTVTALARLPQPFPVVTVAGGHDLDLPGVAVDQVGGARAVTEHLIGLGHTRIWHVAGPGEWIEAEGRLRGWRAALEAAGLPVPAHLAGDWSPASGHAAGREIARAFRSGAASRPTAVFAANDHMALGVLRALHEAGVRIPLDVAVAGFDDLPEGAYLTPPLTTVRQDFPAVGREGIALLLRLIDEPATPVAHLSVRPELVVRASTAEGRPRGAAGGAVAGGAAGSAAVGSPAALFSDAPGAGPHR